MRAKLANALGYSLGVLFLLGCGRMNDPKPPEVLSPTPVASLTVSALTSGIKFEWKAPENNQDGKLLKQIDGYRIYRKGIETAADLYDKSVSFEEIAFIEDTHLQELEELKEKAKEEGAISRRVKIADEKKNFTFTDSSLEPGKTYAYLVVPVNQGSEDGAVDQMIRVVFLGSSSEVQPLAYVKNAFSF